MLSSASMNGINNFLRAIARQYFYLGSSGSGTTMKLVVNTLLGVGMQAIAEVVALGQKAGLNRDRLFYGQPYQNNPKTGPTGTPGLRQTSTSAAALPSPMPANPARSVRSAEKGLLRKEGEYWTVGYGGRVFRLKDTKGLAYLAPLLRSSGA